MQLNECIVTKGEQTNRPRAITRKVKINRGGRLGSVDVLVCVTESVFVSASVCICLWKKKDYSKILTSNMNVTFSQSRLFLFCYNYEAVQLKTFLKR